MTSSSNYSSNQHRYMVASNPSAPEDALEILRFDSDDKARVLAGVALGMPIEGMDQLPRGLRVVAKWESSR